jgi:hypothetical protein
MPDRQARETKDLGPQPIADEWWNEANQHPTTHEAKVKVRDFFAEVVFKPHVVWIQVLSMSDNITSSGAN